MDLCCLIDSEERLAATDLVTMLGDLLERGKHSVFHPTRISSHPFQSRNLETKFRVKPLPHARIPIVKLSLDPSPALPLGIACDIGFENRLALENTRLLYCYAMIDPARVRTLVLFREFESAISRTLLTSLTLSTSQSVVQAKVPFSRVFFPNWRLYVLTISPLLHRKINSPYQGTLSSYGYVLLVIYFLVHVKNPPVLPNLQQMPPMRPISHVRTISSCLPWLFAYVHAQEDTHIGGHNTWYIFCEHVTFEYSLV